MLDTAVYIFQGHAVHSMSQYLNDTMRHGKSILLHCILAAHSPNLSTQPIEYRNGQTLVTIYLKMKFQNALPIRRFQWLWRNPQAGQHIVQFSVSICWPTCWILRL